MPYFIISISANADGPRDAASRKIDHIALRTIMITRQWASVNEVSLHDDIVCYMNGSKQGNTGSTGAGIFNSTKGEELVLPLGKVTTVYQAEICAVLLCAQSCSKR